jgi:hypothetical protein
VQKLEELAQRYAVDLKEGRTVFEEEPATQEIQEKS